MSSSLNRGNSFIREVTHPGKSRSLQSLIRQDLKQHSTSKQGLLLIGPHGHIYDDLLALIAPRDQMVSVPKRSGQRNATAKRGRRSQGGNHE